MKTVRKVYCLTKGKIKLVSYTDNAALITESEDDL